MPNMNIQLDMAPTINLRNPPTEVTDLWAKSPSGKFDIYLEWIRYC